MNAVQNRRRDVECGGLDFLSTRSVLYRLEPQNRGTSRRESLTSLALRLASAHHLGLLRFSELIADELRIDAKAVNHAIDRTFGDGGGQMALLLSSSLATLTGHRSLTDLTLLPIGAAKTSVRLTPGFQRWCPTCFADDISTGGIPYGRLIWSLVTYEACHVHGTLLCTRCPHCAGGSRRQNVWALPNSCRSCGANLATSRTAGKPSRNQFNQAMLAAAMLDDARFDQLTGAKTTDGAFDFIDGVVERLFDGLYSRLAKHLGLNLVTVRSWVMRQNSPTIENTVLLAEAFQVPLIEVYLGDPQRMASVGQPRPRRPRRRPGVTRGSSREKEVKKRFEQLLAVEPPPTLKRCAELLGVSINFLKARFPDGCRSLRDKAVRSRYEARLSLREETFVRFREIAEDIAASGRMPTVRNVFEVDDRFRSRRVGFLTAGFYSILSEVRAGMRSLGNNCNAQSPGRVSQPGIR